MKYLDYGEFECGLDYNKHYYFVKQTRNYSEITVNKEIRDYLRINKIKFGYTKWVPSSGPKIFFENVNDSIRFKLMFG